MTTVRIASASLLVLTLAACSKHAEEDPAAEGCEHLKEGPSAPIMASATTAGAPAVAADHKRYDVMVGATGGVVSYVSSKAGQLHVFLGSDVTLKVTDAMATTIMATKSTATAPCAELKAWYEVHVAVGTYHLTLGPNAAGPVSVVLEAEDH